MDSGNDGPGYHGDIHVGKINDQQVPWNDKTRQKLATRDRKFMSVSAYKKESVPMSICVAAFARAHRKQSVSRETIANQCILHGNIGL